MTILVSVRSFPLIDGKRMLPEGVIYIGRAVPRVGLKASRWGNPFRVGGLRHPGDHPSWRYNDHVFPATKCEHRIEPGESIQWLYVFWLRDRLIEDPGYIEPLRGKTLACWCDPAGTMPRDFWCHGLAIMDELEWHRPRARQGQRIEFGLHTMPNDEAEDAPAWPSLSQVKAAADARFRREQRKAATR